MTRVSVEKKKKGFFNLGKHWPLVIVLMLLAHASLMFGTIVYVGGKRDTYVDPEYYAKSVDWDRQRAMKEASQEQGWTVTVNARAIAGDPTQRSVEVQLHDASGNAIEDAMVELVCYHPASLSERLGGVMPFQDGLYTRSMPIERTGIWVAELTIQRRGVRALLTKDLDVVSVPQTANP